MQFPESWLREFCNPPISSDVLAELLTMSGMEVEEARPAAPRFHGVVVGEVVSVARHPNADRLNVCQVDAGKGDLLSIVCGAPNVRAGIKVPCALVGAELPPTDDEKGDAKPFAIKLGQLRGVESQGMLCSARELKLSEDHGGLLILDDAAIVGQDIREHLKLDDTLLTLKLTPNLAHCLSVYGVARELSALTGSPLSTPVFAPVKPRNDSKLSVKIEALDLCGRFSGRVVRNVNTKAVTPAWMVDRLARCGQRSVTALVDISNYVMFEYGRPSHIFDLDKIHDGLTVRWGRPGESLKLLNGTTVEVDEKVGVIADSKAVESLAGIMGGDTTAVSGETKNVYVEAAFWWPEAVAGRSRRFNFSTDAGHRFERGVDPAQTVEHIERITQLILDICGGEAGPVDDQLLNVPQRQPVKLRVDRAAKVIGMPISQDECEGVMQRLGFSFTAEPDVITVKPPSWRFDLQIEEDLIEEVIRVLGYETLPSTSPLARILPRVRSESQRDLDAVRHRMATLDYQETINFSFVDERWETELSGNPNPVRLVNPMASQMAVMRSSLLGSLIGVLKFNLSRKASRVRIFEAGRAFLRDASVLDSEGSVAGVSQPMRLSGLAYGPSNELQWGIKDRAVDFFDIKGDIEALLTPRVARFVAAEHPAMHPGRCARIELDGNTIGFAGELHPKWRQGYELPGAPILFELDASALMQRELPVSVPIQRQQSVWRDLSIVADESVTHALLTEAIEGSKSAAFIRSTRLFDIYKPSSPSGGMKAGERSMSIRLELLDDEVSLTDERSEAIVAEIIATLAQRLGVQLRA
jgi:phenylalanyl-tRNA synthetase beta chain